MQKDEARAFSRDFTRLKLPFSRRLSYMSLTLDGYDCVRVHVQKRTYAPDADKNHSFLLMPTAYGNPVPCEFTAEPGLLTAVGANGGYLKFTFDGADVIRVRGFDVSFMREETELFDVVTVAEDEYVIVEKGKPVPEYRDFDECVRECAADFDAWYAMYPEVAPEYEETKRLAVYMVWICQIAPRGKLLQPAILYTKPTEQACFSWHQVYHAMAMRDADAAVQTLMNLFPNQDEFGELPDLVDDTYVNITATKPPLHGYGLLYILDRIGDKITREHCEMMYGGLEKLFAFWTTLRDTDGDGVPQYNHGCESGYDFSEMFAKGVPVETPDIITYVALLAEALGKLAQRLGMDEKSLEWQRKSEFLINALVTEFWTGERFVAKLSGLHETVEYDELEAYLPLMLGARLPTEIVARLARDLRDPAMYFSPHGLRAKPKRDGVPGIIMGFSQVKILPGLYFAGEKELALQLLRGYCDYCAANAPSFLFAEPSGGADVSGFAGFTELSALSGAIWLCCASFLREVDNGTV